MVVEQATAMPGRPAIRYSSFTAAGRANRPETYLIHFLTGYGAAQDRRPGVVRAPSRPVYYRDIRIGFVIDRGFVRSPCTFRISAFLIAADIHGALDR